MAKHVPLPQTYPIPDNWVWLEMGRLTEILCGYPFDSERFSKENNSRRPLIRIRDVVRGSTETYTDENCPEEYVIHNGEILIGMDGDFNVAKWRGGDALLNQRVCRIQSNSPFLLDGFLYYYLPEPLKKINEATPSITVKHLSSKTLDKTPIPLPPLPEQQRIVDCIENLFAKLDAVRAAAQSVVDEYELRRDAILYRAFTGELTTGWREKNHVPDSSWKIERIETCFEVSGGIQKQKIRIPKDNPVPYVTVANVFRNKIDLSEVRYFELFEGELEKYQLKSEDILVVEGNGSGNEIGRCAMWNAEIPVCVHQNHIIRVRKKGSYILPKYVLYYLNSPMGRSTMRVQAKTTAGLYNLSVGKVRSISFPMATTEEQVEIVSILESLLSKSIQEHDSAKETIEGIDTMKKSILARAFRGELGTNAPAEEGADAILQTVQEMRRNSP